MAHHTYPVAAGLHRGLFHCGAGKEKPRSGCGTPRLCLSLKPPEGIQAYTVQMPQPSWDQNIMDSAESQALKLSKSRKLSTFAAIQSLSIFPPRRTVCDGRSTRPPSSPRRRGGGAGTAAPGDSKVGAARWRPPQRTPGGEDTRTEPPESTQNPIIQNPK